MGALPRGFLENLVSNIPQRLRAVVEHNGGTQNIK